MIVLHSVLILVILRAFRDRELTLTTSTGVLNLMLLFVSCALSPAVLILVSYSSVIALFFSGEALINSAAATAVYVWMLNFKERKTSRASLY